MCWGIPGRVVEVDGMYAKVNIGGTVVDTVVGVDGVEVGDYVVVHAGLIVGKLSEDEVISNLAALTELQISNYVSDGLDESTAREKAIEEFKNIVNSLGIDVRKYLRMLENQRKDFEVVSEEGFKIPDNAYVYRVRTTLADTDYLQVVHYTNYLRFCERAWSELLANLGFSYSRLIHEYGIFIPTTEVSYKVLTPSRLDNDLELYVWVENIRSKSIKWRCVVKNITTGKVSADITHTTVCTDTALTQSLEIPKELVEKLMKYLVENTQHRNSKP
jgi:hydrogenase assembly chaperone HypC/HupF